MADTSDLLVLVRREGTIPPAPKVGTMLLTFLMGGLSVFLLVVRRVGGKGMASAFVIVRLLANVIKCMNIKIPCCFSSSGKSKVGRRLAFSSSSNLARSNDWELASSSARAIGMRSTCTSIQFGTGHTFTVPRRASRSG